MNIEDLEKVTEGFEEISEIIKSGEISVEVMREGLEETYMELARGLDELRKVINGEESRLSNLEAISVIEILKRDKENYNKKEHKQEIKTVLLMSESIDKDISEEIFLPFMIKTLLLVNKITKKVHEESYKVSNKAIKKFLKEREV